MVDQIGGKPPTGPQPEVPEPVLLPPDDSATDMAPELQEEMERVMRGEPPPERQPLEGSPVATPGQVSSDDPGRFGEFQGDEQAVDERADPRE